MLVDGSVCELGKWKDMYVTFQSAHARKRLLFFRFSGFSLVF